MSFSALALILSRLALLCGGILIAGFAFLLVQPFVLPGVVAPDIPAEVAEMVAQPGAIAAMRAANLLTLIPALIALWHAARLLAGFAQGAVLTRSSARHLRWIGGAIAVRALLMIPAQSLGVALLTLPNPPGQRLISVGVSPDHLEMLIYGGLIWLIGAAMRMAADAAAENAEFI